MEITIHVRDENFKEGDLLLFKKGEWVGQSKSGMLKPYEDEIKRLKAYMEALQKNVNDKLAEYHKILQVIDK